MYDHVELAVGCNNVALTATAHQIITTTSLEELTASVPDQYPTTSSAAPPVIVTCCTIFFV